MNKELIEILVEEVRDMVTDSVVQDRIDYLQKRAIEEGQLDALRVDIFQYWEKLYGEMWIELAVILEHERMAILSVASAKVASVMVRDALKNGVGQVHNDVGEEFTNVLVTEMWKCTFVLEAWDARVNADS